MEIISKAKFVKNTPDKLRNLTKLAKGKAPEVAISQLEFSLRAAAVPLISVIKQGMDQIKTKGEPGSEFKIVNILIDEGPKLKRRRIRHQGRATAILKRMAHITIIMSDESVAKKSKVKSDKPNEAMEIKKEKIEGKNGTKS